MGLLLADYGQLYLVHSDDVQIGSPTIGQVPDEQSPIPAADLCQGGQSLQKRTTFIKRSKKKLKKSRTEVSA
jgi:hypothetical protein